MKRALTWMILLALAATLPLTALADGGDAAGERTEILFQGIPWETDFDTVRKLLIDKGFPMGEPVSNFAISFWAPGLAAHSSSGYGPPSCGVAVAADRDMLKVSPVTIAGYPINNSWVCFVYDYSEEGVDTDVDNAHFIFACMAFDTLNPQYVYNDLVRKLSTLYGEPESVAAKALTKLRYPRTEETSTTYCDYSIWYGANDTAVLIEYRYEIMDESLVRKDDTLKLIYGKTDGKERVNAVETLLQRMAEEEQQRQLELEQQQELERLQRNQNDNVNGL